MQNEKLNKNVNKTNLFFECKNCGDKVFLTKEYEHGRNLKKSAFKSVDLKCEKCQSEHKLSLKFCDGESNNILAYLIYYEKYFQNIKIKSAFWFNNTEDKSTISGYMTECYLSMGFDDQKSLNKKINLIANKVDKSIIKNCVEIIRMARNAINQHNKDTENLSSLLEDEIYPLFSSAVNTIAILFEKNNDIIYDVKDRRTQERKVIFKKIKLQKK